MDISGHEEAIIVGLPRKLTCSTRLQVTSVQWFLVGLEVPLETTTEQKLVFTVDPEDSALNGAMFTCKVSTVSNTYYEETITLTVKGLQILIFPFFHCI